MDDDDWMREILSALAWAIAGLIGGLAFVIEISFAIGMGCITFAFWLLFGGDD